MAKDAADAVPQNRVVVSGGRYLFDDSLIYSRCLLIIMRATIT